MQQSWIRVLEMFSEKYVISFSPNHRKAGENKSKSLFFWNSFVVPEEIW